MLEELHSRSGHRVLRCAGRLLASREDPVREATRWVNSHRKRFSGRDNIIVLGVGCGYHLELLAQEPSIKKVVGLDFDSEALDWVGTRIGSHHKIRLASMNAMTSEVKTLLKESYAVLRYFPSLFTNPKGYEKNYEFLLGRNLEGAKFIFSLREEFSQLVLEKKNEMAISIHNIQLSSNEASQIWRALGELVS